MPCLHHFRPQWHSKCKHGKTQIVFVPLRTLTKANPYVKSPFLPWWQSLRRAVRSSMGPPLKRRWRPRFHSLHLRKKVALTHAQSKFSSAVVPRLGIPDLWHTDGPHGIRPEVLWDDWDQAGWTNDNCTASGLPGKGSIIYHLGLRKMPGFSPGIFRLPTSRQRLHNEDR